MAGAPAQGAANAQTPLRARCRSGESTPGSGRSHPPGCGAAPPAPGPALRCTAGGGGSATERRIPAGRKEATLVGGSVREAREELPSGRNRGREAREGEGDMAIGGRTSARAEEEPGPLRPPVLEAGQWSGLREPEVTVPSRPS